MKQYDIAIVGGGIVGLTMACLLAEMKSLRIAVVENAQLQLPLWKAENDNLRVSAVTNASIALLKKIGIWSQILQKRASPFREMHVWDKQNVGEIHFDSAQIGEAVLGYIVENNLIQHCLYSFLQTHTEVEFIFNTHLQSLSLAETHVTLMTDNSPINAKLVIGADGAQSWVRQQMQGGLQQWDYGQHALVATIQTELSHQETAWQHFMPTGPLAFLPLHSDNVSDFFSSIVWSTTPEHARDLMAMNEDDFKQSLLEASEKRLGNILKISQRASFPLTMRHAKQYVNARQALIGDAAHTIHPLAGQGLNLGFQDAASLAQIILEAYEKGKDPGLLSVLRPYERCRRAENTKMIMAMEGFKRLFSNENTVLSGLRNFGLAAADKQNWLKNFFMRCTM